MLVEPVELIWPFGLLQPFKKDCAIWAVELFLFIWLVDQFHQISSLCSWSNRARCAFFPAETVKLIDHLNYFNHLR